jgi:hypothetical protein
MAALQSAGGSLSTTDSGTPASATM